MKVIDLYNLISNKEYDKLPTKIKLKKYDNVFTLREDCSGFKWYGEEVYHSDFGEIIHQNLEYVLNCEVEVIEEDKKIEKLSKNDIHWSSEIPVIDKVNEIIDKINSMEVK